MIFRASIVCFISIFAGTAGYLKAQVDPAAERILKSHVNALGGVETIKAIESRRMTGKMTMPETDVVFDIELIQAEGKYLFSMKRLEFELRQGFDGQVVWEFDSFNYRKLEGAERVAAINNNSKIVPALSWIDGTYDGEIKLAGREVVEKTNCFVVDFYPKGGAVVRRYFDPESYMIRRYKKEQEANPDPIKMQIKDSDFKEFGGILFPMKQRVAAEGKLFYTITYDKIEINPQIKESFFELPPNINGR